MPEEWEGVGEQLVADLVQGVVGERAVELQHPGRETFKVVMGAKGVDTSDGDGSRLKGGGGGGGGGGHFLSENGWSGNYLCWIGLYGVRSSRCSLN